MSCAPLTMFQITVLRLILIYLLVASHLDLLDSHPACPFPQGWLNKRNETTLQMYVCICIYRWKVEMDLHMYLYISLLVMCMQTTAHGGNTEHVLSAQKHCCSQSTAMMKKISIVSNQNHVQTNT